VNACPGDDSEEEETVVIAAAEFRLPDVLRHIEAGKIVRVIPAPRTPAG
jgi:hypothetical protein